MSNSITLYQCSDCGRYFSSEGNVLEHQSFFRSLHKHDPKIAEHKSGWRTSPFRVGESRGENSTHWLRLIGPNDSGDWVVETWLPPSTCVMSANSIARHLSEPFWGELQNIRIQAAIMALGTSDDGVTDDGFYDHVSYLVRKHRGDPDELAESLAKYQIDVALMVFNETRETNRLLRELAAK